MYCSDEYNEDSIAQILGDPKNPEEESQKDEKNAYLEDSKKGLELISKICCSKDSVIQKRAAKLEKILDEKLLKTYANVELVNEFEYYLALRKVSDRIKEYLGIADLDTKSIVGIGGMFSAGKSAFINSILGYEDRNALLSMDQTPTTSIPTFIVKSNNKFIRALTVSSDSIVLNEEEMRALTHSFYEKYTFGFNQYISKIIIGLESFDYPNLAILDTPGYSKADGDVKQNFTDKNKAFTQLRSADYLIWLIDCENGTIKSEDIEFLESINTNQPILFVFNKCDKKLPEDVEEIVEESKFILEDLGFNIVDIIPYSARDKAAYSRAPIDSFLQTANKQKKQLNAKEELKKIVQKINQTSGEIRDRNLQMRDTLRNTIRYSSNPSNVVSLCSMYKYLLEDIDCLQKADNNFKKYYSEALRMLDR